jgi:hypothetical protein
MGWWFEKKPVRKDPHRLAGFQRDYGAIVPPTDERQTSPSLRRTAVA